MDNLPVDAQPESSDRTCIQENPTEVHSASQADSHPDETVGTAFDREMMQRCLALARRALGQTAPNPLVGSVIIQNGEIVGEGFSSRSGASSC